MVTLNGMDYMTNTAVFSISKAADIANLPTTTSHGVYSDTVSPGSMAYLTDGSKKKYLLDGDTNTWKES